MKLKVDYFSKWLLVILALTFTNMVIAQRTITGTVTDEATGEALIGANVLVVGTSTGTVTDFDGTYSLSVPSDATQLEFSYTGYSATRVTIGQSNVIDVQLSAGELLEEVVVTGYTTQKAREVSSAITSVKEEDFNKGNVTNPAQLLQGKVPGLTITRPGNDPNGGFNIRLRGLSTIGANINPLVVIDGVVGADLNTVDPSDIASIDVLKDGSAAAIYGTRASSGVIIITTKRGREGVSTVDYNGFVSFDTPGNTIPVLSPQEFLSLRFNDPNLRTSNFGTETDWFDEITRTGVSQTHNLSMSGGTKQTSYRVAVNYRDVDGIALNTGFRRFNGRLNLTQKALKDRLTINATLSTTNTNQEYGNDEAYRQATIYNPTAPVSVSAANNPTGVPTDFFDTYDGYFQQVLFNFYNPVAILEQNTNEGKISQLLGSLQGTLEILPGLSLTGFYSRETNNGVFGFYSSKASFLTGTDRNGFASRNTYSNVNELVRTTLQYEIDFGNNSLKLFGGYEWNELRFEGFNLNGGNFITDAFGYNNIGASLDFPKGLGAVGSYQNDYRNIATFAQAELNIANAYFIRGTARYEGNSRFGEDNKWALFPAISAGVDLTRLANMGPFNTLKLRAGYGITGAIPGSNFLSLLTFGRGSNFFYNGAYVPSYGPSRSPNTNLKWERKGEANIGLDFGLLNYRLTGSIDVYNRTTRDLLYPATVPVPPNVSSTKIINVGELRNTGVELGLNFRAIETPSFSWQTGANLNIVRTKLVSLSNDQFDFGGEDLIANAGSPGQNEQPMIRVKEGQPIGEIFAPHYLGVGENGAPNLEDKNNDGKIDFSDYEVVGNGYPDFEFGWNNNFTFGSFDFNFFLRGAIGHNLINQFRQFYEPVDNASWNRVNTKYFDPALRNAQYSDYYVEDASFARLDNATLGYTFKLPEGSSFRQVRLYVSGQNLFTISGYTGADPEVRYSDFGNDADGGTLAPGIDRRNTYFVARTLTFGLNLGF